MRIGELHRCAIACSSSGRAECRCSMVPNVTRATVRNTRAHRHFGTRLSPRFASPPFWSSLSLSLSLSVHSPDLLLASLVTTTGRKRCQNVIPPLLFFHSHTRLFSLSCALLCSCVFCKHTFIFAWCACIFSILKDGWDGMCISIHTIYSVCFCCCHHHHQDSAAAAARQSRWNKNLTPSPPSI